MGGGGSFAKEDDDRTQINVPTVGRVVHLIQRDVVEPLAATVAYVHEGSSTLQINVGALNTHGTSFARTSVPHVLLGGGDAEFAWEWPPRA